MHTDLPVDPIAPVVSGEVPAPAINIAALYAALAADIRSDTRTVPDFSVAVRLTHLLDTVLQSGQSGQRLAIAGESQPLTNRASGNAAKSLLSLQI